MDITLNHTTISGTIPAIASKSHAHRLLICAALADGCTQLRCTTTNRDIDATADCLRGLGAEIVGEGAYFCIAPIREVRRGQVLDCGESGSTMRFLLPVVTALAADGALFGHGRLPERPLSPLYEVMTAHGAVLDPMGTNPLRCGGCLTPGEYEIDGGVSSQFISGLLFALPLLNGPSRVKVTGKVESRPYIDMTLDALRRFGVPVIEGEANVFDIGVGGYHSPGQVETEGDWSNAAFWLTAGAFSETGVTMTCLNPASLQGDREIVSLLRQFGAQVAENGGSVTVKQGARRLPNGKITINAANIPDLVPILTVGAAGVEGTTVIEGCGRLRLKESDRIATVCGMISALGGEISAEGDTITVRGHGALRGGTVEGANDHRIVMAAAVGAGLSAAPVTIRGAEAVNKSYPGFFEDYRTLGGLIL